MSVFSPDGQLLQVKYAQELIKKAYACVGIKGGNCIVLATEKRNISNLQVERVERKIVQIDDHILLAYAGLKTDARVMISRAQIECRAYMLAVDELVPVEYITKYIAGLKEQYTRTVGRRPFGISCLIAGYDSDGIPHLYQTQPSGVYTEWKAKSTGRCENTVLEFLEKNFTKDVVATEAGAVNLAIRSLLEIKQPGLRNLEVAVLKRGQPVMMVDDDTLKYLIDIIEGEK